MPLVAHAAVLLLGDRIAPYVFAVVAICGYLIGSIPFGYILVRVFLKQDIRETGSGNIGATNVARSGRKGLAIATLLLDALKGFLPAFLMGTFFGPTAALFSIIGHMFPVWLKFRGGKGVATGAGAFLALAPIQLSMTLVIFAVVVAATRYVSLGSIAATVSFPILLWFTGAPDWRQLWLAMFLPVTLGAVLIIVRHKENIARLLSGTENKFGSHNTPPPTQMEREA